MADDERPWHNHGPFDFCSERCPRHTAAVPPRDIPPFNPKASLSQPRPASPMQVRMLTEALTMETRTVYLRNAEFHQGIDLLARTLPLFVQVMATEAQRAEALRRFMQRMDMTMPSFSDVLKPEGGEPDGSQDD